MTRRNDRRPDAGRLRRVAVPSGIAAAPVIGAERRAPERRDPRVSVRLPWRRAGQRARARAGPERRRRGPVGRDAADRRGDRRVVLQAHAAVPPRPRAGVVPPTRRGQRVPVARTERTRPPARALHERARRRAAEARPMPPAARPRMPRSSCCGRRSSRRCRRAGPSPARRCARRSAATSAPICRTRAQPGFDRAGLRDVGARAARAVRGRRRSRSPGSCAANVCCAASRTSSAPTPARSPRSHSAGDSATRPTSRACSSASSDSERQRARSRRRRGRERRHPRRPHRQGRS